MFGFVCFFNSEVKCFIYVKHPKKLDLLLNKSCICKHKNKIYAHIMQQDWEVKELKKKDKAMRMFKTGAQSFNAYDFVSRWDFFMTLSSFPQLCLANTHSSCRCVSKGLSTLAQETGKGCSMTCVYLLCWCYSGSQIATWTPAKD